jgi:hypothetical protein
MACPQIDLPAKRVILLSGYRDEVRGAHRGRLVEPSQIAEIQKLRRTAERHPDAVAFGYVRGNWVAVA